MNRNQNCSKKILPEFEVQKMQLKHIGFCFNLENFSKTEAAPLFSYKLFDFKTNLTLGVFSVTLVLKGELNLMLEISDY